MSKSDFARTIEYLNSLDKSDLIVIDKIYETRGYVPGQYSYRDGRWTYNRDGIWYPISYAVPVYAN